MTRVSVGGAVVDTVETAFGIRSVAYDATRGVLVNGQAVRLQGTCNHHDHGALGTAYSSATVR